MRIHTNLASVEVINAAMRYGLSVASISGHGSRKRDHAFEVKVHGSSSHQTQSKDGNAATWDEWGAFISRVFELDQTAIVGEYWSPEFFRWTTNSRFGHWSTLARDGYVADGIPKDTHQRHRFEYDGTSVGGAYQLYRCSKCSAAQRSIGYSRELSEVFDVEELNAAGVKPRGIHH